MLRRLIDTCDSHGTLLFYPQLADELPMLWAMSAWLYTVCEDGRERRYPLLPSALVLFNVLWASQAHWLHRQHQVLFESMFALAELVVFVRMLLLLRRTREPTAPRLFVLYALCALLAFALWNVDTHLCARWFAGPGAWWARTPAFVLFGSLHGWWHVLMAYSTHCGMLAVVAERAELLGRRPRVLWTCGVPYIDFPHERPKLPHDD